MRARPRLRDAARARAGVLRLIWRVRDDPGVTWDGDAYQARFDALAAQWRRRARRSRVRVLARPAPGVGARRRLRHRPRCDRVRTPRRRGRRASTWTRRCSPRRAEPRRRSSGSSTISRRSTSAAPSTRRAHGRQRPAVHPGRDPAALGRAVRRHVGAGRCARGRLPARARATPRRRTTPTARLPAWRSVADANLGPRALPARRRLRRLGAPPLLISGPTSVRWPGNQLPSRIRLRYIVISQERSRKEPTMDDHRHRGGRGRHGEREGRWGGPQDAPRRHPHRRAGGAHRSARPRLRRDAEPRGQERWRVAARAPAPSTRRCSSSKTKASCARPSETASGCSRSPMPGGPKRPSASNRRAERRGSSPARVPRQAGK